MRGLREACELRRDCDKLGRLLGLPFKKETFNNRHISEDKEFRDTRKVQGALGVDHFCRFV